MYDDRFWYAVYRTDYHSPYWDRTASTHTEVRDELPDRMEVPGYCLDAVHWLPTGATSAANTAINRDYMR